MVSSELWTELWNLPIKREAIAKHGISEKKLTVLFWGERGKLLSGENILGVVTNA